MKPQQHRLLLTPLIPRTQPLNSGRSLSNSTRVFAFVLVALIVGFSLGTCFGYFSAPVRAGPTAIFAKPAFKAAISIVEPIDVGIIDELAIDPATAGHTTDLAAGRAGHENVPSISTHQAADPAGSTMLPTLEMFAAPAPGASHYHGKYFSQVGQDDLVDELLDRIEGGFFVESGAYNGVELSNTLFLEATRGWTGLLVEANPYLYREIITNSNRTGSAAINACVSPSRHSSTLPFRVAGPLGGLVEHMPHTHSQRISEEIQQRQLWVTKDPDGRQGLAGTDISVACWPLHSLLTALGQTRVDYWSLDTEGSEADILRATDFDQIDVRIITVEVNDAQAEAAVLDAMADKPYHLLIRLGSDLVFVKRGAFAHERLQKIASYNPSFAAGTGYDAAGPTKRSEVYLATAAQLQPVAGIVENDWPQQWFGPEITEDVWPGSVEDGGAWQ